MFRDEFKEKVLKEVDGKGNMVLVTRNYNRSSTTINIWIQRRNSSGKSGSSRSPKSSSFNLNNYNKEIENENGTLKKIFGEKDLEIAILKDPFKKPTDYKR